MCGITGYFSLTDDGHIEAHQVRRSASLLYNRGPDDFGLWQEEGVALAHRRLSIIDITKSGSQPMHSSDGRYVIVFNGEIYNHHALRTELGARFVWRGCSDTEVLLNAYIQWGIACLDKVDGMFAFAVWDRHKKKLVLARDRIGEKPLFYHVSDKQFLFASRPKALFALNPMLSKEYDYQGMRLYLEGGYVPSPFSIHKSLKKLPAAHYLEASMQGIQIKRYWNLSEIQTEEKWNKRSESDLLDELNSLLVRSVQRRMISDVPIGAFLSSGIDSSLVVAMMSKVLDQPVKTFTIGFDEKQYDESQDAARIAQFFKTDHHVKTLKVNDLLKMVPLFLNQYDEPFFDSSAFPTMAVSKLARNKVTVALTGDGGDELFGGYHYYQISQLFQTLYKLPTSFRLLLANLIGILPKHQFKLLSAALKKESPSAAFAFSRSVAKDFCGILKPSAFTSTYGLCDLFQSALNIIPSKMHTSEQSMRLDLMYTLSDDYLQKTDLASMSFSLECRTPMLEPNLMEFAMKLPLRWKIRGNQNKYLLRKLAYSYMPRELLDRPKRGFGVPIAQWLRGPLKDWAKERIYDVEFYRTVPLVREKVISLFELHQKNARNVHPLLWAVLMLIEYHSNFQR